MKKFLFALFHKTGLLRLVSWFNRKKVAILCYHSVVPDDCVPGRDPHKQHIPLSLFLKHLDYLQGNYRVIPLTEFVAARRNNHRA